MRTPYWSKHNCTYHTLYHYIKLEEIKPHIITHIMAVKIKKHINSENSSSNP